MCAYMQWCIYCYIILLQFLGRNSADIPGDAMYDRLSPKLDNTYDQVANEFRKSFYKITM